MGLPEGLACQALAGRSLADALTRRPRSDLHPGTAALRLLTPEDAAQCQKLPDFILTKTS